MNGFASCPLRELSLARPDAEALVAGGERFTWRTLDAHVTALAAALAKEGIAGGDSIALLSENSPALVMHLLALARLGARAVLLNTRLTPFELNPLVARVRPRRIFAAEPGRLDNAEPLRVATAQPAAEGAATLHPSAGAILFTSGTTGQPRPALLLHRTFVAAAAASRARLGTGAESRWLCSLPLFHVGGLAMLWRCLYDGSTLVLSDQLEPGITHASFVAAQLQRLLEQNARPLGLKVALVGGGPTPRHLVDAARAAGFPVRLTYGLTEACSQVSTQVSAEGYDSGVALDGAQVRIASPNEAGEGEIQVRGPSLFAGYLYDERASACARDGAWLKTGDFGTLDARGTLRVLGRRLDLLVSGGENVYPAEIEATLLQHPSVRDAGVLPQADERWGQVPLALVVSRTEGLDEASLRDWCKVRLASFKVPARFRQVAALPRNAMGKLDRRALNLLGGQP